jgi:hypothetical protein
MSGETVTAANNTNFQGDNTLRKLRGARTTLWDLESTVMRSLTNGRAPHAHFERKQYRSNVRGSRPRAGHANREEKCVPHDCEDY